MHSSKDKSKRYRENERKKRNDKKRIERLIVKTRQKKKEVR